MNIAGNASSLRDTTRSTSPQGAPAYFSLLSFQETLVEENLAAKSGNSASYPPPQPQLLLTSGHSISCKPPNVQFAQIPCLNPPIFPCVQSSSFFCGLGTQPPFCSRHFSLLPTRSTLHSEDTENFVFKIIQNHLNYRSTLSAVYSLTMAPAMSCCLPFVIMPLAIFCVISAFLLYSQPS